MFAHADPRDGSVFHAEWERDSYALIGQLLVRWAAFEKQIASTIHFIEAARGMAAGSWPLAYTDLEALRAFKQRKGHLRRIFEVRGNKKELAHLDLALQLGAKHSELRHGLAHHLVSFWPPADGLLSGVAIQVQVLRSDANGPTAVLNEYKAGDVLRASGDLKRATMMIFVLGSAVIQDAGPPVPRLGVGAG